MSIGQGINIIACGKQSSVHLKTCIIVKSTSKMLHTKAQYCNRESPAQLVEANPIAQYRSPFDSKEAIFIMLSKPHSFYIGSSNVI